MWTSSSNPPSRIRTPCPATKRPRRSCWRRACCAVSSSGRTTATAPSSASAPRAERCFRSRSTSSTASATVRSAIPPATCCASASLAVSELQPPRRVPAWLTVTTATGILVRLGRPHRQGCGLDAVARVELDQDRADVGLHCSFHDVEGASNLGIGVSRAAQRKDVTLAFGQRVDPPPRLRMPAEGRRRLRPAVKFLPFTAGQHLLAVGEEVAGTEAPERYLFDRWPSGGVFAAFVAIIVIAAWYLFK